MLEGDALRARWVSAKGQEPSDADVDRMYANFVPMLVAQLKQHSALIPGGFSYYNNCTCWAGSHIQTRSKTISLQCIGQYA